MKLAGWGRYPTVDAEAVGVRRLSDIQHAVARGPLLARGLGRSYGDSSLFRRTLDMTGLERFVDFDPETGVLTCEAGLSLSEILRVFVPRGWFPPVTPGTRFVTIGGAIASDVHGKNHHKDGSFSDHVERLSLVVADGSVLEVSRVSASRPLPRNVRGDGSHWSDRPGEPTTHRDPLSECRRDRHQGAAPFCGSRQLGEQRWGHLLRCLDRLSGAR